MSLTTDARRIVATVRDRDVTFMAASFAHYALASLIPLLLVALALLSYFGAADALIEVLRQNLSDSGAQVVNRILQVESGRGVAGGIGLLLSLWSGLKVFRGLSIAFAEVYDTASEPGLVEQLKKGLLVLGLFLLAFALLVTTGVVLATVNLTIPAPRLFGNLVAVVALVLAFLPLYYVLPPVPVTVRHALPGTLFAAVGWVVLQVGFSYYTQTAGKYAAYGIVGALLLFVLFLYFGGIVLLVGAVINVVIDRSTPTASLRTPR
ncbi:YihY/virulence factor BrkB family protein [Halobium salinum]|uniref:YihY/virulence factor BrkB family protein n=1 Tax=Halobium salinum TaxID=1364940 RepID=A0ABD5P9L9_9EURY|nr:YihY/virulence factor BrkB family protein [Halobium salinum]